MKDTLLIIMQDLKEKALDSEFTPEKSRFVEWVDGLDTITTGGVCDEKIYN